MSAKANTARNVYAFSLRGAAAMNSYAFVPAIPDDVINKAIDREYQSPRPERPAVTWVIEDLLARYFAPGYRETA